MDRCDDEAPALPGLRAFWGTKGLRGGRAPLLARERSSLPSNSLPSPQRALSGDGGCVVRCMRKRESPQACGRRERACLRLYGHRQQRATRMAAGGRARYDGGSYGHRQQRATRMAAGGRARYDGGSYGHRQQRATEWRTAEDVLSFTDRARTASRRRHAI